MKFTLLTLTGFIASSGAFEAPSSTSGLRGSGRRGLTGDCRVDGCGDGQICVVNNCGEYLKHCDGRNTQTIESGTCQDLKGAGQRLWVGEEDSNCYSSGNTLFEYTYPTYGNTDHLAWDVSLLSGFNHGVKVQVGSDILLDLAQPTCGEVRKGLFPCTQPKGNCNFDQPDHKWPKKCAGCDETCCDTTDGDHDCNPEDLVKPENLILTFCPSDSDQAPPVNPTPVANPSTSSSAHCGYDSCTDEVWNTLAGDYTCGERISFLRDSDQNTLKGAGISDGPFDEAEACRKVTNEFKDICTCHRDDRRQLEDSVQVSVKADFEKSPECIYEQFPLSVFTQYEQITVEEYSEETFTISKNRFTGQMHFGIQGNDWYWRTKENPVTSQWADNAGTEVIIKDAAKCDFELKHSWNDDHAPDAREVFNVELTSQVDGCHFTVTRKSNPGLSITHNCVGPCSPEQFDDGCECTSGGSTENCATSN